MDHSPIFCSHMGFFISPLVLTLLNRMEWLSARTVIWLKSLTLSYFIIRFLNFFGRCYLSRLLFGQSYAVLHDKIPHFIIFPNQSLFCVPLRVFGCVCFVHIFTPGQDKLLAKATKCLPRLFPASTRLSLLLFFYTSIFCLCQCHIF